MKKNSWYVEKEQKSRRKKCSDREGMKKKSRYVGKELKRGSIPCSRTEFACVCFLILTSAFAKINSTGWWQPIRLIATL